MTALQDPPRSAEDAHFGLRSGKSESPDSTRPILPNTVTACIMSKRVAPCPFVGVCSGGFPVIYGHSVLKEDSFNVKEMGLLVRRVG